MGFSFKKPKFQSFNASMQSAGLSPVKDAIDKTAPLVVAEGQRQATQKQESKDKLADAYEAQRTGSASRISGLQADRDALKDRGPAYDKEFMNRLISASKGEGPSAAQDQLKMGTDRNLRSALAMGRSGRGNPALAMQSANRDRTLASQQGARQAASLRAQEMESAQDQLLRAEQTEQARQGQTDAMNRYFTEGILGEQRGQDSLNLEQQLREKGQLDDAYAESQQRSRDYRANRDADNRAIGTGILKAGMTAMSDERRKKNVSKLKDGSIDEFFGALEAKNFQYKDPHEAGASGGKKVGMMAQDVEGTELGSKLFQTEGDGVKRYDPQVMQGIMMSAISKLMRERK